jgi:hypothetical protein
MAKRVLQADGSYCYTENCKIHDRLPAVGLASLVHDAQRGTRRDTVEAIEEVLRVHKKLYRTKKPLHDVAEQITDSLWNADQRAGNLIGNIARRALKGEEKGFNDEYDWEKMTSLSDHIQAAIVREHQLDVGTRVIVAETGQIGHVKIADGTPAWLAGPGPRQFQVEIEDNGRPATRAFTRTQLVKINDIADEDLLAREQIAYAQENDLLPAHVVSDLLRQEVADDTYNAHALRGSASETRTIVQAEFRELADLWDASYQHETISKDNIVRYLNRQTRVKHANLDLDEAADYYQGLSNVGAYLAGQTAEV